VIDVARDFPPLGHVGYIVENVDKSVAMYRELLGIDNFRVYDFEPMRAWASGTALPACRLRIAIGNFKNDVKIELIQPLSDQTPHARFLAEKGPGLHHVAFYTRDYDDWHAYFKSKGAEFAFEAEAEDDMIGYRRSLYAQVAGMVGLVEITQIAYKRR
jgi:methylmalonyl-CoA/ethylmalonyl-CoA epimerase